MLMKQRMSAAVDISALMVNDVEKLLFSVL